jgi:hypothetical protein
MNTLVSAASVASATAISSPARTAPNNAEAELVALEAKIMAVARDAEASAKSHNRVEKLLIAWSNANPCPKDSAGIALWRDRIGAVKRASGFDDAEIKWDDDCSALSSLTQEIADVPATTMAAITIKRRIARYKTRHVGLDGDGEITDSIKRDLRRMRKALAA